MTLSNNPVLSDSQTQQVSNPKSFGRWTLPNLASENRAFAELSIPEQESAVQQIFESAREQGYQQGLKDGFNNARPEVDALLQSLRQGTIQLEKPLAYIDKTLVKTIAELTIKLTEKLIRAEIKTDPLLIKQQLDEALGTLSQTEACVSLRLHPQDARTLFSLADQLPGYERLNIMEDASIERGDCYLATSTSSVESSIKDKLSQMAEQIDFMLESHGQAITAE